MCGFLTLQLAGAEQSNRRWWKDAANRRILKDQRLQKDSCWFRSPIDESEGTLGSFLRMSKRPARPSRQLYFDLLSITFLWHCWK